MPVVQVCLRAARVFCLVDGSLSAGFVWGSGFPVLLFILLGPDLSLSLSLSLGPSCSSLSPLGFSWLGLVSVLATFVAWIVPRHLMVAYLLVSLRFFPVIFRSLFPTFLVGSSSFASLDVLPVRSSGLSRALVALPGSLLCLLPGFRSLSSQFPVVGLVLCFLPCGPAPGLSLFGLLAVPPFLLSRFVAVCFPGLWVSLFPGRFPRPGLLFPGSRTLQLPTPWYSRWHLDPAFCSSGVLHPTLSRDWSLVSVSWDGFSDSSVGSKVFFLTFLTLFSVGLSPV